MFVSLTAASKQARKLSLWRLKQNSKLLRLAHSCREWVIVSELAVGDVGFVVAGIKNVRDTRVGDTVTDAKNPAPEALPGYRRINPMVFCGLYPIETQDYNDLREALEKLELNDASLRYEAGNFNSSRLWLPLRIPWTAAYGNYSGAD